MRGSCAVYMNFDPRPHLWLAMGVKGRIFVTDFFRANRCISATAQPRQAILIPMWPEEPPLSEKYNIRTVGRVVIELWFKKCQNEHFFLKTPGRGPMRDDEGRSYIDDLGTKRFLSPSSFQPHAAFFEFLFRCFVSAHGLSNITVPMH